MIKKFIRDHKIHKDIVSLSFFDYIFLYKPIYLLGPISMILVGMYLANFANGEIKLGLISFNTNTSWFIFGTSLILSCIFIKCEILNITKDLNHRFNFIEENIIEKKIDIEIKAAFEFAKKSKFPKKKLLEKLYKEIT